MKPCVFRLATNETHSACANNADLVHDGVVPNVFCMTCPYIRESRGDFFTQTTRLLIDKQRSGEYRPRARSCGGCGEPKRRKPDQPFDLQFVWPYWHAGANGDEIRFSVRSVETFFDGRAKCTVIGDKPPWFNGHYIPQQRVPARTQSRSYRDMLTKVWTMATHPEIDTDFVWMMDDIYFLKPFTVEDIETPRAERWRASDYNKWQRLKTQSMAALTEKGFANNDYATHMPHHVEKDKLQSLYETYDLHNKTLLWEILYGNTYRGPPAKTRPFFARIGKEMTPDELKLVTRRSTILNHNAGAWGEGVRGFLLDLMPNMASIETDIQATPVMRKVKQRTVKRRPAETHRGYVKAEQ
jgi:hypothetical protein